MRFNITFDPGNFGEILGSLGGGISAMESEEVAGVISKAFLEFSMERAMRGVDLEARTSVGFPRGGEYRYAYAGGHPDNIGRPEKRLFKAEAAKPATGQAWSISYETLSDNEVAWSPVLLENTDWVYRDRMQEAMGPSINTTMHAPSAMGKSFYAVARDGSDIVYRDHFQKQVGGKQDSFEGLLESKLAEAGEQASGLVNAGTHAAITKALNTVAGTTGATGASKRILAGHATSFKNSKGMFQKFMYVEMAKIIKEA